MCVEACGTEDKGFEKRNYSRRPQVGFKLSENSSLEKTTSLGMRLTRYAPARMWFT